MTKDTHSLSIAMNKPPRFYQPDSSFPLPLDRYDLLAERRLVDTANYRKGAPLHPYEALRLYEYTPESGEIRRRFVDREHSMLFRDPVFHTRWNEMRGTMVCQPIIGKSHTHTYLWRATGDDTRIRGHGLASVLTHGFWPHTVHFKNEDATDLRLSNLDIRKFIDYPEVT